MATASVARNDVYLSLLAGRAVTALADLSGGPSTWNARVENGLRDGIIYCQTIRLREGTTFGGKSSLGWDPLKHSVQSTPGTSSTSTGILNESEKIEKLLSEISLRNHEPDVNDLISAIEFFRKTATDR